jgi:hypothetical protein
MNIIFIYKYINDIHGINAIIQIVYDRVHHLSSITSLEYLLIAINWLNLLNFRKKI